MIAVAWTIVKLVVPTCKDEKEELYGALKQETVALRCEVEASPPVVTFKWTFNNSGEQSEVPPSRYTSVGTVSTLHYTPLSEMDYGTLSCWGTNSIGGQKVPCVYQVVAAGRPFPLVNCSITNQTTTVVQIECTEGFDGGLPQWFLMEVAELPERSPRFNISSPRPHFTLTNFDNSLTYEARLYAVNGKGRSEPYILQTISLRGMAKLTGGLGSMGVSSSVVWVGGVAGAAGLLAASSALTALLCRYKAHRLEAHRHRSSESNPDVVPSKYERRSLKTLMRLYKAPSHPKKPKGKSGSDGKEDKEIRQDPFNLIVKELECYNLNNIPPNATLPVIDPNGTDILILKPHNQKLIPEVVTANHKMQESCI